jgi:hypothetical protein
VSIYNEAIEKMQAGQAQQRQAGAVSGLAAAGALGTPYPREGALPQEVIEFLTMQLGTALAERNALRGRVWQLEGANNSLWLQRQDTADTLIGLRGEVAHLTEQLKQRAPEKQFVVIGCFGGGAKVERPMEMLSCASANGQTRIRVDARVSRRKRVD